MKKGFVLLPIALLVAVIFILLFFIFKNNLPENKSQITEPLSQNTPSQKIIAENKTNPTPTIPKTKEYSFKQPIEYANFNSDHGFNLQYPKEWGNVVESITDNVKEGNGYTGKSYTMIFSLFEGELVRTFSFAVGHSADFSAARGVTTSDYNGDSSEEEFVKGWILLNWRTIYGKTRGDRTYLPYPDYGMIDFNLPGKEISGARLYSRLLSEEGRNIFIENYELMNYPKPTDECLGYGECDEVDQNLRELLELLRNEGKLDDQSEVYISIYEHLLQTSNIPQ